jgi:2-polyprenyl-6-hydroxyphenyl methylase/3-demethylubiquinone-9 3-methyltransferase
VDDERIVKAEEGLARLFPGTEVRGSEFLDIGCGSGLSSLAAARMGAARIVGIDLDADSVDAAQSLLTRFLPDGNWSARVLSVFDLDPADGLYDIVYSWGVLHHTGDMWRALGIAAGMVKPQGLIAVALYRKTRLCPFWKVEKRVYSRSPRAVQLFLGGVYMSVVYATGLLRGKSPARRREEYAARGMDWKHDVPDWLGGYPYESTSESEVVSFMAARGFERVRSFAKPGSLGLTGSGCDEYVFRKK